MAAYSKALKILNDEPSHIKKLSENIKHFRKEMNQLGFEILGHPQSAICPVLLRDEKITHEFAEKMYH